MNRTEDILARLQRQQPEVSNPDELTSLIMSRLEDCGMQRATGSRRSIVRTLSAVSAMAAVWLIGIFVFTSNPAEQQRNASSVSIHAPHASRSETYRKMYSAWQQKNKCKQLSYTQLKRMIYENR